MWIKWTQLHHNIICHLKTEDKKIMYDFVPQSKSHLNICRHLCSFAISTDMTMRFLFWLLINNSILCVYLSAYLGLSLMLSLEVKQSSCPPGVNSETQTKLIQHVLMCPSFSLQYKTGARLSSVTHGSCSCCLRWVWCWGATLLLILCQRVSLPWGGGGQRLIQRLWS